MSSASSERHLLPFSFQLTLWYAVFFVVTVVCISFFSYYLLARTMQERNSELVETRAQEYRAWLEEGGIDMLRERFYLDLAGRQEALFVRILGPARKVLFFSVPTGLSGPSPALLPGIRPEDIETWSETGTFCEVSAEDGEQVWIVSTSVIRRALVLQVGMSVTQTHRLLSQYRLLLWFAVLPASLLGVLGGWWLAHYSLRPVRRLRRTLERIIESGDMSERVPTAGDRGALGELVVLANRLLESNDTLIRAMRDSLDVVAHDLKTPLTRLRNSAEAALTSADDGAAAREALSDCMEESQEVVSMLDTLMDLAEARGGSMQFEPGTVELADLLRGVVDLYAVVAEAGSIVLHVDTPPQLEVRADRRRLQQAMANLLDNAIKYSEPGGEVDLRAWREGDDVHITVVDRGLGITEEDLPRIWDRLYRGTGAASRRGLGLGLSLVKAIVEAHGGAVTVASTPGEGSTFTVTLPALPATRLPGCHASPSRAS